MFCPLITALLCLTAASNTASAATYYCVRSDATGDNNGSDWTNAWTELPSSLERGATYYIADGTYGGHTFNDPEDGEKYIYIKKAVDNTRCSQIGKTPEECHGPASDWQDSYGDGVANFVMDDASDPSYYQSKERWAFKKGFYIFDGQVGGGPGSWDSGHGFKLIAGPGMSATSYRGMIFLGDGWSAAYDTNNIEFRHIEITSPYRSQYDQEVAIFSHINSWDGPGGFPDENQGSHNITISHCYIHDLSTPISTAYTTYWTVEYNYIARNDVHSAKQYNQGTGWHDFGSDNHTIRYNIFEDIDGTANIDLKKNHAHNNYGWEIYGNVFWNTPDCNIGGTGGNGVIGDTGDQGGPNATSNMKVYNNAFVNINANATLGGWNAGIWFAASLSQNNKAYNNIWYNCVSRGQYTLFKGVDDHDYNWFYGNIREGANWDSELAASEIYSQLGTADPFVDWQNKDFRLKNATVSGINFLWMNDKDMFGNTRGDDGTWDRGAIEYVSGSPDITAPTIISVTVHSPVYILFSEPLDVNSATNVQHYKIEPNITIYSATLEEDLRTVVLTTSAHSANVEYTLTVNGVKDVAGNTMVRVTHIYHLIANAGSDQTVTDTDGTSSEQVKLDGSASSNPDGTIVSWAWTDDLGDPIPDVEITTATLSVGTHTITLTVTDEYGATDTDTVTIIVNPGNQTPTADAGTDQTLTDDNGNGSEPVALDASGSTDPDGNIVSWVWTDDLGDTIPDGETTTAILSVGTHTITLTVTDNDGATDTDTVTITINEPAKQAPTANAGLDQTLTDNDRNGSEPVALDGSGSTDPDGNIVSWVWTDDLGDTIPDGETTTATLSVGTHTITLTVTDDDGAMDTDTVVITVNAADTTAPSVTNLSPQADSIQAPLNSLVILGITDSGDGVEASSVEIRVNNNLVYAGNTETYNSADGVCRRAGTKEHYKFAYQAAELFDFDQTMTVTVDAKDLADNPNPITYSYSFKTEMRSFGEKKKVGWDSADMARARPVTARDSSGNIWAAWEGGPDGSRDIYISGLAPAAEIFSSTVQVTDNDANQCNPTIAIGSDNKIYLAWQDNRRGNWDIYVSTSTDGSNWSTETRVTDSNDNQTNPTIAIDGLSPNGAHIVWQDDRAGKDNQDIYIATSSNDFLTKTVTPITSNGSDQIDPAIAVDYDNTVYVVWTDTRSSSTKNDIYGAASNDGPWTNIPVVTKEESQSRPAIATEAVGSILHLLWVDDRLGDDDIFYAQTSGGLPQSPLTGSSIIDDSNGADQLKPVIAVAGSSTGNNLQVFACWQDERDADDNLYFDELSSADGANVFVDIESTNTDQREPAMGIDGDGYPYLVWTNDSNDRTDICYSGSTFFEPDALVSKVVTVSAGGTVGVNPNDIDSLDDVSVVIPKDAFWSDINVTISRIHNLPALPAGEFQIGYEIGPSGVEFSEPVTVIIPYEANGSDNESYTAYWYNSQIGALSQQGITSVETIVISPSLHALRFKTTHFSLFIIGGGGGGGFLGGLGGLLGGGGGGCSMSAAGEGTIVEFFLPYIGLTVAMVILKLRDTRKRKARNITKS